jgi:hypothetical protein
MISAYRDEYQKFWNIQGPKGPLSLLFIYFEWAIACCWRAGSVQEG